MSIDSLEYFLPESTKRSTSIGLLEKGFQVEDQKRRPTAVVGYFPEGVRADNVSRRNRDKVPLLMHLREGLLQCRHASLDASEQATRKNEYDRETVRVPKQARYLWVPQGRRLGHPCPPSG